jgi:hypothetical protein
MRANLPNRIQTLLSRGKDSSRPGAIADSVPFYSFSAREVRKVNSQLTARPTEQIIAAIQALDLDPIKVKLMDPEEGQGWSREYVDQMAIEYKRFLTLSVKYPQETIAPSKNVDKFWHGHILDTMKYAEDCQNVFGYFLHHFPYFGMRGEADAANLAEAGRTTQRLHEQEFGKAVPSQAAMCGVAVTDRPAMCGVAVTKDSVAMCGVAVTDRPAMCGVAVTKDSVAMCGVAVTDRPAMCGVAVTKDSVAMCGVAVNDAAAMCGVAVTPLFGARRGANSDMLNSSVRPRLALAA